MITFILTTRNVPEVRTLFLRNIERESIVAADNEQVLSENSFKHDFFLRNFTL